jgi:hypothetical protein
MHISHVVVDGSNIATEARSLPSLAQLDEAVKAFIAENDVGNLTVIVDATFGHRIDESERAEFDQAIASAELVTPPAGAIGRGDAFVLQVANRVNAVILSNDSFQEFHGEYPWLFDEGRLMGGKPVPGVGWVFLRRTPVRGPASRRSTRDAKRKRDDTTPATEASEGRSAKAGRSRAKAGATAPKDKPSEPSEGRSGSRRKRRSGTSSNSPQPMINEAMPFLEFLGAHPVGSEIEATVAEYSSHGAYVTVDDVRCYAPLHALGDPAPQRARDVVTIGETRRFTVTQVDGTRRGIDVALVPGQETTRASSAVSDASTSRPQSSTRQSRRTPAKKTAYPSPEDSSAPNLFSGDGKLSITDTSGTAARDAAELLNVEEEQVAVKKATKKATKKAPARKAAKKATKKAVKKAPARKAAKKATKKAPARKAAKKATKKAPARKAAKKATKKAPARKAAKKATKKATKKAPARKAAKKATKKAPARKAAKKATKKATKKAPARKAAKKATKKAPARKTAAKKATKKAPARKTAAKKATKKAPARKTAARRR